MLINEILTPGHARTLITIEDEVRQNKLADCIVEKNLNVRETEKLISDHTNPKKKRSLQQKDANIIEIEEKLKSILGTKVGLQHYTNKGKIIIEYYSNDEFERIVDMLTNK